MAKTVEAKSLMATFQIAIIKPFMGPSTIFQITMAKTP
jgi:hypothetical protein